MMNDNLLKKYFWQFIKYFLPVIIWGYIIFSFSASPAVKTSEIHWQDFIVKKLAHIFVYAIFTILIYRSLTNYKIKTKIKARFSVLVSFLYGFTDEFHQSFTPGREPTLRDVAFDTLGAIIGIMLLFYLVPKLPKKLLYWMKQLDLTK